MPSKLWSEPEENHEKEPSNVEIRLDEISKPELAGHAWIQRGTELMCTSCPFTHATFIPSDYQLYGINDKGEPMLRKVEVNHRPLEVPEVGDEPRATTEPRRGR